MKHSLAETAIVFVWLNRDCWVAIAQHIGSGTKLFFCSFYVTLSLYILYTKNYGCMSTSSGVACGEYKDKEGQKEQKNERRP